MDYDIQVTKEDTADIAEMRAQLAARTYSRHYRALARNVLALDQPEALSRAT